MSQTPFIPPPSSKPNPFIVAGTAPSAPAPPAKTTVTHTPAKEVCSFIPPQSSKPNPFIPPVSSSASAPSIAVTSSDEKCSIVLNPLQERGPEGQIGPQGPIGPVGPQGPVGPEGPIGPVGPQGPVGPEGPIGPIGPVGPASQDVEVVIRNNTGATLLKGQVVYVTGALGQKPTVALASASGEMTSSKTFGVVKADINNNSEGTIVNFGLLEGINTNAFNEGNTLWLSTTPGGFTNIRPTQPNHGVHIGWVIKKSGGDGHIFVQIQNGFELHELHTVLLTAEKDGDVLEYDGLTDLWKNKAPDKSPVFTYTSGLVTRVDYASGAYKIFTYSGTTLTQLQYFLPGRTITKAFSYNIDGTLASINQTEVYN